MYRRLTLVLLLSQITSSSTASGESDQFRVGVQPDGRIVVPTNQILHPAGTQITFPGRPVSLLLIDGGKTLVAQSKNSLVFIDTAARKLRQTLPSKIGLSVIGLVGTDTVIYTSDAKDHVQRAERQADGTFQWTLMAPLVKPKVDGAPHPAGMVLAGDELFVTSTRGNNVQRIDLLSGKVMEVIPVGVAPFTICLAGPARAYVSNWGGDPPSANDPQVPTSKTPVKVDARTSVANHGSVSVLEKIDGGWRGGWRAVKSIAVGLHPSGLVASMTGRFVYVANANSDTVSVIDTKKNEVVETINCRPEHRLPFGSGCNALALSPNGETLYVANGSNNCVAVLALAHNSSEGPNSKERPDSTRLLGLIPTGWYPGAIAVSADGKTLFVANIKGHGSLSQPRPKEKGMNTHDHLGSVSIIDVPDTARLAEYTERVNANNRLGLSLAGLAKPRPDARPRVVPEFHGEPSLIEHVIYVIKENRTYDQVFGGLKEGKGEPKLVMFGENVTPNFHALARQYTLFDNFYCSGVLSADGHSWVNAAYVTDYLERSFGTFTRSYPFEGSDPLAFPSTGFLWNNALTHKKTFRNFGEFCKTSYTPAKATWSDVYRDYKDGTKKVKIEIKPNLKTLEPYTHPGFPGFPLKTPDVYRARL